MALCALYSLRLDWNSNICNSNTISDGAFCLSSVRLLHCSSNQEYSQVSNQHIENLFLEKRLYLNIKTLIGLGYITCLFSPKHLITSFVFSESLKNILVECMLNVLPQMGIIKNTYICLRVEPYTISDNNNRISRWNTKLFE